MPKFSEYPKMLYRKVDGAEKIHGVSCRYTIVENADEESKARSAGYYATPKEAAAAAAPKAVRAAPKRKRKAPAKKPATPPAPKPDAS